MPRRHIEPLERYFRNCVANGILIQFGKRNARDSSELVETINRALAEQKEAWILQPPGTTRAPIKWYRPMIKALQILAPAELLGGDVLRITDSRAYYLQKSSEERAPNTYRHFRHSPTLIINKDEFPSIYTLHWLYRISDIGVHL